MVIKNLRFFLLNSKEFEAKKCHEKLNVNPLSKKPRAFKNNKRKIISLDNSKSRGLVLNLRGRVFAQTEYPPLINTNLQYLLW